ncbi:MAG: peptide chain release factor 2 [Armatimonadota bacterium]|nr:peptide chain release factor 2 [Armatimonadota bacterium]
MLKDVIEKLTTIEQSLEELGGHLDVSGVKEQISRLEQESASPEFWEDAAQAQRKLKQLSRLKASIEPFLKLQSEIADLKVLAELTDDPESPDAAEIAREVERVESDYRRLELETLLSGEHDSANAILEINAGAGGTEACDWVSMLLRMYIRWAERRGFRTEILNSVEGEVAGLKNVTVLVEGRNAYGYLKHERGVHRLVRISPFDANKRRHTTFAAVDVIPELDDDASVEINPEELRIDTFRASGAGGQHVNKTESAVRITHIPTGIVVTCQNERSQHKNRENAMKVLAARLAELQREQTEQRIAELRGDLRAIEWGNQIRSYVFQPYTMVKDHRTNYETGDVIRVMDGDIDDFIQASMRKSSARNAGAEAKASAVPTGKNND